MEYLGKVFKVTVGLLKSDAGLSPETQRELIGHLGALEKTAKINGNQDVQKKAEEYLNFLLVNGTEADKASVREIRSLR